ncbi:hypothetical protein ACJ41O_003916 [Fusarium nematophilum]
MPTPSFTTIVISTPISLRLLMSSFPKANQPLYIDLEGQSLGRNGTVSIITIFSALADTVWLIDVATLGASAFTLQGLTRNRSLKSVLEDSDVKKYFWDVRNDADALWSLYGVKLEGVVDIQLLENASRSSDKTFLSSLAKAIQRDGHLGFQAQELWLRLKKEIMDQAAADIFSKRPLGEKTKVYCTNDVVHLPRLREHYLQRITEVWRQRAIAESEKRVVDAQSPTYDPQGPDRARGPWGGEMGPQALSLEEYLERLQERELGYYEDVDWDSDGRGKNAHDGAMDSEAFYSCWDKN